MTLYDIIRMAREAGLFVPQAGIPEDGALYRFANLVAAAEREACADEVTDMGNKGWDCYHAAEAIRARNKA